MKCPAPLRSSPMKITIVQKGSSKKPMMGCPFEVDNPLVKANKK